MTELWYDCDNHDILTVRDIVINYAYWLEERWGHDEYMNVLWALDHHDTLEGFWRLFNWVVDPPEEFSLQVCINELWNGALHKIHNTARFRIEEIKC